MFKCFFWGLSPVLRLGLKSRDYWQIKCNNPHASTSLTQCDLQRCTGIDACVHSIIKLIKKMYFVDRPGGNISLLGCIRDRTVLT